MRILHLALGVANIEQSVTHYSARLGVDPVVVIPGEYALWRTPALNLSIRKAQGASCRLRHLGWEDAGAKSFTSDTDCNAIIWENFSAKHQAQEINALWPDADYHPD